MTATELIARLEQILIERNGKDAEVVFSTNLQQHHDIIEVIPTFNASVGSPGINLMSLGAMQEVRLARIGLFLDEYASKLN